MQVCWEKPTYSGIEHYCLKSKADWLNFLLRLKGDIIFNEEVLNHRVVCFRGITRLPAWTSRPHLSFPGFLFWFLGSREDVGVLKCYSQESSPGSLGLGSRLSRGFRKEGAGSVRLFLGTEFLISTCCVYRDGFCYITGTPVSLYKLIRGLQLECQSGPLAQTLAKPGSLTFSLVCTT